MKRLLSFLGTGRYEATEYFLPPDTAATFRTPYIAVALARWLAIDETVILATKEAEDSHGATLAQAFMDAGLPPPRLERITPGRNPEELWRHFEHLSRLLASGGETVLDITHGFRSQPFFAGAVISYVRATGGNPPPIRILYGAFDARGDHGGRTPVWDLTPFVELTDWTQAIRTFLGSGDGDPLVAQAEALGRRLNKDWALGGRRGRRPAIAEFAKALRRFSRALTTVRTGDLLLPQGKDPSAARFLIQALEQAAGDIETHIPPLAPVLEQIHTRTVGLLLDQDHLAGTEGQQAMAALARLYLDLGRHAEAAIILREGWVNLYAPPAATRPGRGFDTEARREAEQRMTRSSRTVRELAGLRNDIEHGGFRKDPKPPETLHQALARFIEAFETASPTPPGETPKNGTVWFVSRHPGAIDWAERRGIRVDRQVTHLEVEQVEPGDTVIGTLPVHLAAAVCARGARYFHLSLDMPPEARGRELNADELETFHARLEEYRIAAVTENKTPPHED